MVLEIFENVSIGEDELELSAIRSQGAGGQNVNKVASAIHLRFDIDASSLTDFLKQRLHRCRDKRITKDGIVVIKAQKHRTQEKNRADAIERLLELIRSVSKVHKTRISTKPSKRSRNKRMDVKTQRGKLKTTRNRVDDEH